MTRSTWVRSVALVITLISFSNANLQAQDFRVDTDVYLGDDEETFSEHLTLFHGPVIYDFAIKGTDEITILDLQAGEFTLLDTKRRVLTKLTTADLLDFGVHIKGIGTAKHAEDLVAPKFDVKFDDEQKTLELVSRKITYRAACIAPPNPDIATRYLKFTDWYARLNSLRPPNLPHFGRLELNRELADRNLLPEDIERIVDLGRLFRNPQKARSRHVIGTVLSGTDRRRIDEAGGYLVSFTEVSPKEYMRIESVAAR